MSLPEDEPIDGEWLRGKMRRVCVPDDITELFSQPILSSTLNLGFYPVRSLIYARYKRILFCVLLQVNCIDGLN